MKILRSIRWSFVVGCAFSTVLCLFVATALIVRSGIDLQALRFFVLPATGFSVVALFGYVAARQAKANEVLHGFFVGAVAVFVSLTLNVYFSIGWDSAVVATIAISETSKLAGGATGGYLAHVLHASGAGIAQAPSH